MSQLIGREEEVLTLEELFQSKKAEFLAVYGRRRVGKTMLISTIFEAKPAVYFKSTGVLQGTLSNQLGNFTQSISEAFYQGAQLAPVKNWREAFRVLHDAIKTIPANKKIILFMDEFPWLATKNSTLLSTLDYFWNHYWSRDARIKLIICGSSAAWMINKIINNKGGLHNRITRTIHLTPYNLRDTHRYLKSMGITLPHDQVVQLYMVTGGVPYYLSYIKRGLSATQNISQLAFARNSFLLNEFDNLFSALFDESESYINIVRTIAQFRYGIAQEELFNKLPALSKGGSGSEKLKALEHSSFILRLKPHKNSKRGVYYKVIDEYTLFYFSWIEPLKDLILTNGMKKNYWESIQNTAPWYTWAGYSFEAICYKHIHQISDALSLSPTALPSTWRYSPTKQTSEEGAQVDLLFDRKDNAITLCEIKYTSKPFEITKSAYEQLQRRISVFKRITRTKKHIFLAMIASSGLKKTIYSEELIDGVVTLDDLFKRSD